MKRRSSCLFVMLFVCVAAWATAFGAGVADSQAFPRVQVSDVRRVFHNGEHNAFTDLIRFRDRFYLTFRSCPDGHAVYPTASVIVLESGDAQTWEQVHRFSVPKRDTRDPHFLVFKDHLFVYTGTWYCGDSAPEVYEMNQHLGYAITSSNGRAWSDPIMLEGTYGHYIWRAAAHKGTAYLCGRRKREFIEAPRSDRSVVESAMLESDDGLVWRTKALFQTTEGSETAFRFEPDGAVLAVCRLPGENALLCRSNPPYARWSRRDLGRYIGGPLFATWGDRYLVGGRKTAGAPARTALSWLIDGELHEFAVLPSGGDNSYPGFVELNATRGLVSWYSSHEKDDSGKSITAIYLAELKIVE